MSEYSRSTDINNAIKLRANLSESDKMLIDAMANTMLALFKNMQMVQTGKTKSA